jgi:hypothetical protein
MYPQKPQSHRVPTPPPRQHGGGCPALNASTVQRFRMTTRHSFHAMFTWFFMSAGLIADARLEEAYNFVALARALIVERDGPRNTHHKYGRLLPDDVV